MRVRVAVVDPLPMFVRGVTVTLREQGHPVDAPDDILSWVRQPGAALVLLTIVDGRDWTLLSEIVRARPDALPIAVLPDAGVDGFVRALVAGAVGVIARDATAPAIDEVVRVALTGRSLLPSDVLRKIVAGQHATSDAPPVTDNEVDWLRRLANGGTVAGLAEQVGYSERMMFRLLADLYARLGVPNRTMAIIRARDEGWL